MNFITALIRLCPTGQIKVIVNLLKHFASDWFSASISLFSVENASQPVLKIEAGSNVGEGSFRSELNWFWCNTWHSFEKGTFNTKETFRKKQLHNWGYFDLLLMWENGTFSKSMQVYLLTAQQYVWFKNPNIFPKCLKGPPHPINWKT